MSSWLLPIICFVLAVLCLLCALRLTGRLQWLLGWLRGMAAIACAGAAFGLGGVCFDLLNYRPVAAEPWVGNISFQQTAPQRYEARLVDADGKQTTYLLSGDQWQLDVRVFSWQLGGRAPALYRFDRVSGRYLTLEQERGQAKTSYAIAPSALVDAWEAIKHYGLAVPLLKAGTRSISFLPMADGALYSLSLGADGFLGQPLNQAASSAMADWYSST